MKLHLWKDVLWDELTYCARCPEHRVELDILDNDDDLVIQGRTAYLPHKALVCPADGRHFVIPGSDFYQMQRHFKVSMEALNWKDAQIVSLDGYQIPVATTKPPQKDSEYWVEARINDTNRGKQLVVYAGKRGANDKAQIFIDTENDKISFDQNNIHPNDIFTKLTAEFASGKKATMENATDLE